MRPSYLRQESPMMRRLRQADYDAHRLRPLDALATEIEALIRAGRL